VNWRANSMRLSGVKLTNLAAPRYVPRSVFVGERAWVIEMVDANEVTSLRYPRPLHEPYGL